MDSNKTLSFAGDIRPMFTGTDVAHMKPAGLDLSAYDDVKARSAAILSAVTSGSMPPPKENRTWTKEMCETFEQWIQQGCPP